MFCANCGRKIENVAIFCPHCGEKCEEKRSIRDKKNIKVLVVILVFAILIIVSFFIGNSNKKANILHNEKDTLVDNVEVKPQEEADKNQIENNVLNNIQEEYQISKEEEKTFHLRSAEMERESVEYSSLSIEPMVYVGKLCEGYNSDTGESLYDVYYLWLKQEQEVDYVTAGGEIRTKKVKGMILEGDNLNPLVGEDIICYGKAKESYTDLVEVSFMVAAVMPQKDNLKNCTYMDRPNAQDNKNSQILDNIVESYKNMIAPDLFNEGEIVLKGNLEARLGYYGNNKRRIDIYGGYMLEDLSNDNVPELILQGMIDNEVVFFIMDDSLEISVVPGEILYNVPGENLFYTAQGYDDYIFYACWYRQEHSGNYVGPDGRFAYMKAFENCVDVNGNYVGYDYADVILGQNTLRQESGDVSNRLNEVFEISVSPQIYDFSDLSPFEHL